jgi:26S proteasome regulatory subunit N1
MDKEDKVPEDATLAGGIENKKDDKKKVKKTETEISEEDQTLKDGLENAVLRLQENTDTSLHAQAMDYLCTEIKTSTSSMTSVPKPLKFLKPFYEALKVVYEAWHVAHDLKQTMADMLSVLAMTMSVPGSQECLKYKLEGTNVDISSWGHEYVRFLSGEIAEEYNKRLIENVEENEVMDDLMYLVDDIVPFQMSHNAEAEAVDLLMEVQQLKKLVDCCVVDEGNFERVCLYLLRCADFTSDPDDTLEIFNTAYTLYKIQGRLTDALRVALKIDDSSKVEELFSDEVGATETMKQQMSFILGCHRSNFECEDDDLNELIGNVKLSEYFVSVAKDLNVADPKSPEDIYKSHLASSFSRGGRAAAVVDSARENLASSFVNGLVNAGFCTDKLMTVENSQWVYKNKDHGMISAAASLGLVLLWNVEGGLNEIDKFFHNSDENIRAGGCLAIGIVSSGIRNEADPALALLADNIESSSHTIRCAVLCGLGIAYSSSRREEVQEMLIPIVSQVEDSNFTEVCLAALSLGMVFVGSCDDEVGGTIVQRLMEASDEELNQSAARFLCLGLGLLFLGKNEKADAMLEAVRTVEHRMGKYADITLETCAYAGTGNVLMVQRMLHLCAEHLSEEDSSDHQAVAVLGIALMTIGEDIGTEMSLRTFDHLLQYGGLPVKRVVPLAIALLYVSNPDYAVIDQLSRLSHDADAQVSQSAIFGLGVVSAGSNNSRVAGLLRQLSEFYAKEANHLFVVRLAQGLNAMGKGLLSLSAFHSDRWVCRGGRREGGSVMHAYACFEDGDNCCRSFIV